jgi:hypothetical protein
MITTTSEGRIVHWKGMDLSDFLGHEDRLVAHLAERWYYHRGLD